MKIKFALIQFRWAFIARIDLLEDFSIMMSTTGVNRMDKNEGTSIFVFWSDTSIFCVLWKGSFYAIEIELRIFLSMWWSIYKMWILENPANVWFFSPHSRHFQNVSIYFVFLIK